MSSVINVQEAKTRLSELLRRVEAGEEVIIARAGHPIARIQPTTAPRRNLEEPLLPEIPAISGDSLFDEPSADEIAAWDAADDADPLHESVS